MADEQDVRAQFASVGLLVDGPLVIGRLVRCKVDGDKGAKASGWYVLHELRLDNGDQVLVGRFGNWKAGNGEEGVAVEFSARSVSDSERERMAKMAQEARERAAAERRERAATAAKRAANIWAKLPDSGASDYLKRKGVKAWGLRFSRGSIVVPVRDGDGGLVGLQFIGPQGDKKFLTGTPKRACFHMIGEPVNGADQVLAVAEGYATAATVHECTGWPCAVAFDAGNLLPVSRVLRASFPECQFVVCADDDRDTEGNPGVTKAREAAGFFDSPFQPALVAVPDFTGVDG